MTGRGLCGFHQVVGRPRSENSILATLFPDPGGQLFDRFRAVGGCALVYEDADMNPLIFLTSWSLHLIIIVKNRGPGNI